MGFRANPDTPWVCEYEEVDAFRFFEQISSTHGLFGHSGGPDVFEHFVFRGHACDTFELMPSALRTGTRLLWNNKWRPIPFPSKRDQIEAELETLVAFFRVCDRQGLPIPEDSQALRTLLFDEWVKNGTRDANAHARIWPPRAFVSLMALAQHYGVPTRLLDWTRISSIAAYFAAKGALELAAGAAGHPTGRLAVWAFDATWADEVKVDLLRFVTAPAADIENLRVQQGLFMLAEDGLERSHDQYPYRAYDRLIFDRAPREHDLRRALWKFTLPVSEAPELMRLVASQGIDGGAMFPGYAGAAQCLIERGLWRDWSEPEPTTQSEARARFEKPMGQWLRSLPPLPPKDR